MIPHCDITTGKIYGCKKGSYSWWHEKGHLKFNNSAIGTTLKLFNGYVFYFWMLFITLGFVLNLNIMHFVSLLSLTIYFGIDFYEEAH
jgi:hypothetical protein